MIFYFAYAIEMLILLIDKENVPSKKVALKSGYHLVKKFKGTNQYSKKIRDFERKTNRQFKRVIIKGAIR